MTTKMSSTFSFLHDQVDNHRECAGIYSREERLDYFQQFYTWKMCGGKMMWVANFGLWRQLQDWLESFLQEQFREDNAISRSIIASIMTEFDADQTQWIEDQMLDILECDFENGPDTKEDTD